VSPISLKLVGIHAEIGHLIYFNHGAHNSLRIAASPNIRF
jgi:hypothetical protein